MGQTCNHTYMNNGPTIIWSHKGNGLSAEVLEHRGVFNLYLWDLNDPSAAAMKRTFDTREAAVMAGVKACKNSSTESDI